MTYMFILKCALKLVEEIILIILFSVSKILIHMPAALHWAVVNVTSL